MKSYNPIKVKKRIEDGYKFRDEFAHGDRPSDELINELKKQYGDLDNLLTYLIDYLRISIILMMKNDKKELIKFIGDALFKPQNEEKLEEVLSKTKSLILLNNIDLTIGRTISWIKAKNRESQT